MSEKPKRTLDRLPLVEVHDLGLELEVRARYEYAPPMDPPLQGHDWPEETDRPGIRLLLSGRALHAFRELDLPHGADIPEWGKLEFRQVSREATLRASLEALRAQVAEIVAVLREEATKREARLARRKAVIAAVEAE